MRRDHAPLSVGQIGLVSRDGAAMLLSSGWRPHGESKVGWRPLGITADTKTQPFQKLALTTARGLNLDIDSWLRASASDSMRAAFRDNAIDEKVLPRLTAEDLKDLGVGLVGHRRTLLDAIATLRGDAIAKEPPSEALPHARASSQLPRRRRLSRPPPKLSASGVTSQ